MKKFLKSRLFLTKVLPALPYCIVSVSVLYHVLFGDMTLSALDIFMLAITAILLLNLYARQYWLSYIMGAITVLFSLYMILAVLSEHSEFPNSGSSDALQLLITGLLICFSGIALGVLLMIPFKENYEQQPQLTV